MKISPLTLERLRADFDAHEWQKMTMPIARPWWWRAWWAVLGKRIWMARFRREGMQRLHARMTRDGRIIPDASERPPPAAQPPKPKA